MTLLSTPTRYGAVAQTFHWLTVFLVGVAFLIGEGGPESRVYSPERAGLLSWHETLGMLVIGVLVLRVVWRIIDHVPDEPPMPGWMALAAKLTHWALYALLVAVPLTAIVGAWYEGHPVTFLGYGDIGPFGAPAHSFGQSITELHKLLGDAIIWLAGLHAAAALFHHFVMRDRVLLQMLPFGRIKSNHLAVAPRPDKKPQPVPAADDAVLARSGRRGR